MQSVDYRYEPQTEDTVTNFGLLNNCYLWLHMLPTFVWSHFHPYGLGVIVNRGFMKQNFKFRPSVRASDKLEFAKFLTPLAARVYPLFVGSHSLCKKLRVTKLEGFSLPLMHYGLTLTLLDGPPPQVTQITIVVIVTCRVNLHAHTHFYGVTFATLGPRGRSK